MKCAVYLAQTQVGWAEVSRKGLYYSFDCRCRLPGDTIYKLSVSCGGNEERLGALIPKDGEFCLETRIPAKRIGDGEMLFTVVPKNETRKGKFVPVFPEEPFAYISKLKDAYLERRNGQVGVVIKE